MVSCLLTDPLVDLLVLLSILTNSLLLCCLLVYLLACPLLGYDLLADAQTLRLLKQEAWLLRFDWRDLFFWQANFEKFGVFYRLKKYSIAFWVNCRKDDRRKQLGEHLARSLWFQRF